MKWHFLSNNREILSKFVVRKVLKRAEWVGFSEKIRIFAVKILVKIFVKGFSDGKKFLLICLVHLIHLILNF